LEVTFSKLRGMAMDPWSRRRWRRLRPFIVTTVLAVIVVIILLALAQYLSGEGL
jgi:hypothetical protein